MIIGGLQKFSLIDYPQEICAIIFTSGCNFRCPYCHNPELVTGNGYKIDIKFVFDFLKNRVGKLTAISITGGEPTLHSDLIGFIEKIRSLGYQKIKLDTNGTNPEMINELIKRKLVTYVAMDIKSSFERYQEVIKAKCNVEKIKQSIDIIRNSNINYEFRTTAVDNFVGQKDILSIANHIKGAKAYYIQRFVPSKTLDKSFINKTSFAKTELERIKMKIEPMFETFSIR